LGLPFGLRCKDTALFRYDNIAASGIFDSRYWQTARTELPSGMLPSKKPQHCAWFAAEMLSLCSKTFLVMENPINERIEELRELMRREHLAAFIFPSTDPHGSEYVPERWEGRKWISGFDGSAGCGQTRAIS